MSNKTVTDYDLNNSVGFEDAIYQEDTLTMAGAADIPKGTLLARDSSTLKLVLFVKGGATNNNGIPKAIIASDDASTAAGDIPVRTLVKGSTMLSRLVIAADGDNSNIDAAVIDQLRDYSIIVRNSRELSQNEA